jgi:hypothetical protein
MTKYELRPVNLVHARRPSLRSRRNFAQTVSRTVSSSTLRR